MKKIVLFFAFFLTFLFACTKPEKCETNNTGSVKVTNNTGFNIAVDVTWGSSTYNDERTIYNGNYTTYSNVPAGYVEVWGSFDAVDWYVDDLYVSSCETSTFTWSKKKSTLEKSVSELVMINQNGDTLNVKYKQKINK